MGVLESDFSIKFLLCYSSKGTCGRFLAPSRWPPTISTPAAPETGHTPRPRGVCGRGRGTERPTGARGGGGLGWGVSDCASGVMECVGCGWLSLWSSFSAGSARRRGASRASAPKARRPAPPRHHNNVILSSAKRSKNSAFGKADSVLLYG